MINLGLNNIQLYWSSIIFILPKPVVDQVIKVRRHFLWRGGLQADKQASVAWDLICRPKTKRGLRIKNIGSWNIIIVGKYIKI